MKLILGTANMGPKPYGLQQQAIGFNEVRFILNAAKRYGITMLEGSEAYNCDDALQYGKFDIIYKVTHPYNLNRVLEGLSRTSLLGLMYHHGFETRAQTMTHDPRVTYTGASIYTAGQLSGTEQIVEVPLNIEKRDFESLTAPCKIVRSVFGRGELLKKYSVKDCLDYVKSIPNVHGVIVGVNNVKELDEVMKAWHA
jgi:hypothetical protein